MAKINKKSLINLIENLVDKLVESKVEKLVENRIQKLLPMLVEHEVNRLLKEQIGETNINDISEVNSTTESKNPSDKKITELEGEEQLRERFKSLINADGPKNKGGSPVASSNSNNSVSHGGNVNKPSSVAPDTNPDGKKIDTSNPNVQNVMDIMNQDFSGKLKKMNENSKKRNGRIG